ncbi:MAG TPA: ABC transporter substrate-binding protein [Casimicrobiaceae bacterium]|jgi:ABC-type branched-subunit amino acid transport system substrate-binding protein|nr:ABC transporter substrate-binding protein [Casimicrobiaceae bacterium]
MLRWIAVAALAALAPAAVTAQGVTPTTIVVGQSAATTGPASELGTEMRAGALAYFNFVNARGGVNGRRIELRTLDDGYEPDRALANTRRFIETDQAFALFGYVGTPTTIAAMPVFTKAQVPLIGPFTGAEAFRRPFNRYIFNVRASYFAETDKLVDLLATLRLQRIAVFYQNDTYGKAGLEGVERAARARNMPIAATATVERNSTDVKAAVAALAKVDPQAVVMISAYKSCAAFIKAMKAAGIHAQFMNVSFVGSRALATELGNEGRGVAISQVVPFPWNIGTPVVKEYQKLLVAETGKENYSFTSLEGFIAAKVLVEGLRRAGRDLTREKLVTALETMNDYDVGGFSVTYTSADHGGSRYVELTAIGRDGVFVR